MLHISRNAAEWKSPHWAEAADRVEAVVAEWYRRVEPSLSDKVNCSLSLWSNEHCLLGVVASISVEDNSDEELVLDVGFHRELPGDVTLDFTIELAREAGPAIASFTLRKLPLDDGFDVPKAQLTACVADLRDFLRGRTAVVLKELAQMELVPDPA